MPLEANLSIHPLWQNGDAAQKLSGQHPGPRHIERPVLFEAENAVARLNYPLSVDTITLPLNEP